MYKNLKSKCCGAKILRDDNKYHICSACLQPCNLEENKCEACEQEEEATKEFDDWKEEFSLKLYNVYATVFQLSGYNEEQLKEKEDVMIDFVSNIIKKQREEVLKEVKPVIKDLENLRDAMDRTELLNGSVIQLNKQIETLKGLIK